MQILSFCKRVLLYRLVWPCTNPIFIKVGTLSTNAIKNNNCNVTGIAVQSIPHTAVPQQQPATAAKEGYKSTTASLDWVIRFCGNVCELSKWNCSQIITNWFCLCFFTPPCVPAVPPAVSLAPSSARDSSSSTFAPRLQPTNPPAAPVFTNLTFFPQHK